MTSCDFIFKLLQLGISEEGLSQNKRDEKVNTWGRCLNEKERRNFKKEGIQKGSQQTKGTHHK